MTAKRANITYGIIEILYYFNLALILNFSAAYLLDHDFSNGQVGLLLGVGTIFTVILQQLAVKLNDVFGLSAGNYAAIMAMVIVLASAALLWLPLHGAAFSVTFVLIVIAVSAVEPTVNSLFRGYQLQGVNINFSVCRASGSVAFAFSALVIGQFLKRVDTDILPIFYLVPALIMAIVILWFRAPDVQAEGEEKREGHLLKSYPHFALFLVGVALLGTCHNFVETYLIQIIRRVGGDIGNLSIAAAISAGVELPAMLLYKKMYKKFGNRHLLMFGGWMWTLKCVLIIYAPSVYVIYAAELLQFGSFAIYVLAGTKHIANALPKERFLQGQSMAFSALYVGGIISKLVGGQMIDHVGMQATLVTFSLISVAGALVFSYSIRKSLQLIPAKQRK